MENPQQKLDSFFNTIKQQLGQDLPNASDNKVSEFFGMINKVKNNEPCDDQIEPCHEILSECCQAKLETIFASLPVVVKCTKCNSRFRLMDLLKSK